MTISYNIAETAVGIEFTINVPRVFFADKMRPVSEVREYWMEAGKSPVWIDFWLSNRLADLEVML